MLGFNETGSLGLGHTDPVASPMRVGRDSDWSVVSVGGAHTCAIRTDETLWCWGDNAYGQLGDGTTGSSTVPAPIAPEMAWRDVTTGSEHTCAIRVDGTLWCWGSDSTGATGLGTTWSATLTPTQVGVDTDWLIVDGRGYHTCGIRSDRSLWCWGYNLDGQIGDGSDTERL